MKKIIWTGILAGILMLVLGMGLNFAFNFAFPSLAAEYENVNVYRPWSDPLMSIFFAYPLVLGLVLSFIWDRAKTLFKGSVARRGTHFGLAYWFVATIPGMIVTYSSFKVSLLMVLTWTISGFINGVIAGVVFARFNS